MAHGLLAWDRVFQPYTQVSAIIVDDVIKTIAFPDDWLTLFAQLIHTYIPLRAVDETKDYLSKQYNGTDGLAAANKDSIQQLMKPRLLYFSD